jgi:hypothetical protein
MSWDRVEAAAIRRQIEGAAGFQATLKARSDMMTPRQMNEARGYRCAGKDIAKKEGPVARVPREALKLPRVLVYRPSFRLLRPGRRPEPGRPEPSHPDGDAG